MGGKREREGKRPKAQPKGKKTSFLVTLPEKMCIGTSILAPRKNLKQYTYRPRFPLSRTNFHLSQGRFFLRGRKRFSSVRFWEKYEQGPFT